MNVVVLTPTFQEHLSMLTKFSQEIELVRNQEENQGHVFSHYRLNDASQQFPIEVFALVSHSENQGLPITVVEGYNAALNLADKPDIVVRMDTNEHRPPHILGVIDSFQTTLAEAVVVPICYSRNGDYHLLQREVMAGLTEFIEAMHPIQRSTILRYYNGVFPMGFQAFRAPFLQLILPDLSQGLQVYKEIHNQPMRWGLDLLAILLAAKRAPKLVDFLYGGQAEAWKSNRPVHKIEEQKERAREMIDLACRLGCRELVNG
jgi:hypothetical protein